jgi:hypothetical protein
MRKSLLFILGMLAISSFAQVGVHTDFPDNSSAMDIVAANKGLLIPRVTLTNSLANPSPVTLPAVGLLVFNSGPNQSIGFYYWNGSAWVAIGSGGSATGDYWSLTGNAGTIPGTNFLGTTDNSHFLVYTNNMERMRFESDGQIVIDSIAPRNAIDLFSVIGNATQTNTIAAYPRGTGFYSKWGRYGLVALVDTAAGASLGYGVYSRNYDAFGYGLAAIGSNITSFPIITNHTSGIASFGYDGLQAWGRNAAGYGLFAIGSNINAPFNLSGISAGLSATGNYGIIAKGTDAAGRGIVAVGSAVAAPSTSLESEGGAFTGFHGVYGRATGYQTLPTVLAGIGVVGVGYNQSTYSTLAGGVSLGGSFTGDYGVYGKGLTAAGVGVLGVGSNNSIYYTVTNGSGGAFTGYHGLLSVAVGSATGIGVLGAGNNGVYTLPPNGAGGSFTGSYIGAAGFGTNVAGGTGIIGAGNNAGALIPSNGSGGSFAGNTGSYSQSVLATGTGVVGLGNGISTPGVISGGAGGAFTGNTAGAVGWGVNAGTGTGIIGVGNNIATPLTYANGSGGAFTGTNAGDVSWATGAAGTGVIGAGNNVTPTLHTGGSGGAFTGTLCGVYGNATATGGTRYGGYFATTNGQYAYVGGRINNANQKIIGTGTVNTIVKNTKGDLITLTCPEAPEAVFQDFGIGQLINGFCHITLDPDLAINITISEEHPLKVYITPEGDCNGVFVTNKSANGFDVKELQGGTSTVTFSWQIVATRANEEYVIKDGSKEISDYSRRFAPAPGPLDVTEVPSTVNQMVELPTSKPENQTEGKASFRSVYDVESKVLDVKEDNILEIHDDK